MANVKSQIKRNRTNEKARLRNKSARSEVKTRIKKAVALAGAEPGSEQAAEALRMAVKRLDKAAARGIIHRNQAANRKSRLARRINALSGSAAPKAGGHGSAG